MEPLGAVVHHPLAFIAEVGQVALEVHIQLEQDIEVAGS
jgi:hypothetical protein